MLTSSVSLTWNLILAVIIAGCNGEENAQATLKGDPWRVVSEARREAPDTFSD